MNYRFSYVFTSVCIGELGPIELFFFHDSQFLSSIHSFIHSSLISFSHFLIYLCTSSLLRSFNHCIDFVS